MYNKETQINEEKKMLDEAKSMTQSWIELKKSICFDAIL